MRDYQPDPRPGPQGGSRFLLGCLTITRPASPRGRSRPGGADHSAIALGIQHGATGVHTGALTLNAGLSLWAAAIRQPALRCKGIRQAIRLAPHAPCNIFAGHQRPGLRASSRPCIPLPPPAVLRWFPPRARVGLFYECEQVLYFAFPHLCLPSFCCSKQFYYTAAFAACQRRKPPFCSAFYVFPILSALPAFLRCSIYTKEKKGAIAMPAVACGVPLPSLFTSCVVAERVPHARPRAFSLPAGLPRRPCREYRIQKAWIAALDALLPFGSRRGRRHLKALLPLRGSAD